MEQELLKSGEKKDSEEIDFVKEFETDVFLRTCINAPGEASPDHVSNFAYGCAAYQTIAGADALLKSRRALTSKKA